MKRTHTTAWGWRVRVHRAQGDGLLPHTVRQKLRTTPARDRGGQLATDSVRDHAGLGAGSPRAPSERWWGGGRPRGWAGADPSSTSPWRPGSDCQPFPWTVGNTHTAGLLWHPRARPPLHLLRAAPTPVSPIPGLGNSRSQREERGSFQLPGHRGLPEIPAS